MKLQAINLVTQQAKELEIERYTMGDYGLQIELEGDDYLLDRFSKGSIQNITIVNPVKGTSRMLGMFVFREYAFAEQTGEDGESVVTQNTLFFSNLG